MKVVWKFKLELDVEVPTRLPKWAEIISIAFQGDELFIWAIVDPEAERVGRILYVIPTGVPFPYEPEFRFLGTAHHRSGLLVYHVFEYLKDNK